MTEEIKSNTSMNTIPSEIKTRLAKKIQMNKRKWYALFENTSPYE